MDRNFEMEVATALAYFAGFVRHILQALADDDCEDAEELLHHPDETILRNINVSHLIETTWVMKVMENLTKVEQQIETNQLHNIVPRMEKIAVLLHIYVAYLNPELLEEFDLDRNNAMLGNALSRFFRIRHYIYFNLID